AVLLGALTREQAEALLLQLPELLRRCFRWVCREQQLRFPKTAWRPRLHMVKNTAYAWRQLLFFLSLLPPAALHEFCEWATGHLAAQPPESQARFRPVLTGLLRAARGASPVDPPESRRFLGWAADQSWLLQ